MGIRLSKITEHTYIGNDRCNCGNIASFKRTFQTTNTDPNYVHNYYPTMEKYYKRSTKNGNVITHECIQMPILNSLCKYIHLHNNNLKCVFHIM